MEPVRRFECRLRPDGCGRRTRDQKCLRRQRPSTATPPGPRLGARPSDTPMARSTRSRRWTSYRPARGDAPITRLHPHGGQWRQRHAKDYADLAEPFVRAGRPLRPVSAGLSLGGGARPGRPRRGTSTRSGAPSLGVPQRRAGWAAIPIVSTSPATPRWSPRQRGADPRLGEGLFGFPAGPREGRLCWQTGCYDLKAVRLSARGNYVDVTPDERRGRAEHAAPPWTALASPG
jgi:hypothetical protein